MWLLTRILVIAGVSRSSMEVDLELYFTYAAKILKGLVPYRDYLVEYPPGALPFMVLPKIWAADVVVYRYLFMFEILVFDLLGLVLIDRYGRKRGYSPTHMYRAGLVYIAASAFIGRIAYQRFDFIPAVMVLAAVVLLSEGRRTWAWFLLGIGTGVKLYPVILVPLFLLDAWRHGKLKKDLTYGVPAAAAGLAILWSPLLAAAGSRFWVFLSYHGQRGIQLESFYSTALLVAHFFGYHISTRFSFGSWNTLSTVSPILARISLFIMAGLMLLVLYFSYKSDRPMEQTESGLPGQAAMMILAFMIGGKVLSPQYLVWLIPLLAIAFNEGPVSRNKVWILISLTALVTFMIFPATYKYLIELKPWAAMILLFRNGLLGALFYYLLTNGFTSRAPRNSNEI